MDKYEAPEVVSFGEIDFEPAVIIRCSTLVSCSGQTGHCVTTVTIVTD